MANSKYRENILFIVEGEKSEPNLIYHLQRAFQIADEFKIFSYETSIYELYDELSLDEYLDIVLFLKEKTTDIDKKQTLSNKFSKIYLLFDFDPHHQKFDFKKTKSMLEKFKDATDGGKLYINYPMIESIKHLKQMPDLGFIKRTVTQLEITEYKTLVNQFVTYSNYTKLSYTTVRDILIHHLSKLCYILKGDKFIDTAQCYDVDSFYSVSLLVKQMECYSQDRLFIINTSVLYLIDLLQSKFLRSLQKHQIKFD